MSSVIFMSSLERQEPGGKQLRAFIQIEERNGVWIGSWREAEGSEHSPNTYVWYQGDRFDELMASLRKQLQERRREGFIPLIQTVNGPSGAVISDKARKTQMMIYYAECHPNEAVYEQLRKWRREQSALEGRSPFILASNRVLHMIAAYLPHTKEELLQIPGFGEQKTGRYGEEIMQITRQHNRNTAFPLDWVLGRIDVMAFSVWMEQEQEKRAKRDLEREEGKRKLLEASTEGRTLEELRVELSIPKRELLQWVEELDRDGYEMDALVESGLESMTAEEQQLVMDLFRQKGERYLKPIVQLLFDEKEQKQLDMDLVYEKLRLLRIKYRKNLPPVKPQAS
ncbi:HRDC domain-containing protein [Paenibacillus larvae]|uniref:HRDC domain-containing protein n=1 Tax=Paenibacillus larvae TaxID=1464 RepID=UPI003917644C